MKKKQGRPKGEPKTVVQIRYDAAAVRRIRKRLSSIMFYKMMQAEIKRIDENDNN